MYHVRASTVAEAHPLNVKPLGNKLVSNENEQEARDSLMGDFRNFSDEVIMQILGHVQDKTALMALGHTSRVMYAYTYDEELWRRLYFTLVTTGSDMDGFVWRGSWRKSVLQLDKAANIKVPGLMVCLDVLYRPFQCSQVDYAKLFAKVIKDERERHERALKGSSDNHDSARTVLRLGEGHGYSYDELHNQPFILVSAPGKWPTWDIDQLEARFSSVVFRQEAAQWPLLLYAAYLKSNCDESPLYLFDCKSEAMNRLKKEYEVPSIFHDDLFAVFERMDCRPDHAWLIVGPQRSGSTFHKDPNYTSAWNTALSGRKLWVMLPPHIVPPGVGTDSSESEVTSPVGIAEWVLAGFFNDLVKIDECVVAVTFPGECMHVPAGWWHSVINIDDSVALTQNFAPSVKIHHTLDFLQKRTDQISGFTIKRVYKAASQFLSQYNQNEIDTHGFDVEADIAAVIDFCSTISKLDIAAIADEDCGELDDMPTMPIYAFFRLLLIGDGKGHLLEAPATRTTSSWNLVVGCDSGGFTFGFEQLE